MELAIALPTPPPNTTGSCDDDPVRVCDPLRATLLAAARRVGYRLVRNGMRRGRPEANAMTLADSSSRTGAGAVPPPAELLAAAVVEAAAAALGSNVVFLWSMGG